MPAAPARSFQAVPPHAFATCGVAGHEFRDVQAKCWSVLDHLDQKAARHLTQERVVGSFGAMILGSAARKRQLAEDVSGRQKRENNLAAFRCFAKDLHRSGLHYVHVLTGIARQIHRLTASDVQHSGFLLDLLLLLLRESFQQPEALKVPEGRVVHWQMSAARLVLFSAKDRQEFGPHLRRRFVSGKPVERVYDERHLPEVFAAEAAHQQVEPHLQTHVPWQRGIEEVARVFGYLLTVQH